MQTIPLKLETINAILSYLGSQPFNQVAGLINAVEAEAKAYAEEQATKTDQPKE